MALGEMNDYKFCGKREWRGELYTRTESFQKDGAVCGSKQVYTRRVVKRTHKEEDARSRPERKALEEEEAESVHRARCCLYCS